MQNIIKYLTQRGMTDQGPYKLIIPNKEIHEVFRQQIQEWFQDTVLSNTEQLKIFWKAFEEGDAAEIEKYLTKVFGSSISLFDTKGPDNDKERFYHSLLAGLLVGNDDRGVKSNREAEEGFADLDRACQKAMDLVYERRYAEYLQNEGREDIWVYGIAFYKKRCRVLAKKL